MRSIKKEILCSLIILFALLAGSLAAQPPAEGPNELIVLLKAGAEHPGPEEVVAAINENRPIPGGLGEGNPDEARLVIRDRPRGRTLEWIRANPHEPLARLQRYVVLRFPNNAPLDGLEQALERNPHVENVERNLPVRLFAVGSSSTSDPFLGQEGDEPLDSQWGMHLMRIPEAYGFGKGHATLSALDTGLETKHRDLRAGNFDIGEFVYEGGNFRQHLSRDILNSTTTSLDCNVDEIDSNDANPSPRAGHGTHVAGILAATTDNSLGVASACPGCSLVMAKTFPASSTEVQELMIPVARGLELVLSHGTQVVSMSFGIGDETADYSCEASDLDLFCQFLELAASRDVLLAAAVGNDRKTGFVEFPAADPRVIAVGGVERDASLSAGYRFWDESPNCPGTNPQDPNFECGSNQGPAMELVGPSKDVVSSVYQNRFSSDAPVCGDLDENGQLDDDGYGPCTGTSMSVPHIAGEGGFLRSLRPLASVPVIRDILASTASEAGNRSETFGFGVPDAVAAAERTLGQVGGEGLRNFSTPLFSLYSPDAQTHVYTSKPQAASAFLFDGENTFNPVGPAVPGYPLFPGISCQISPCFGTARAAVHVFTTPNAPFPGAPPLVPLYRLRYGPDLTNECKPDPPDAVLSRDFAYTTTVEGIEHFKNKVVDADGLGYDLDAVEGYVFDRCTPEPACIPDGAVKLYRLYHPARDDYALFPETELAQMQAAGYIAQAGLESVLGYVYPNADSDGDTLIDGFESLVGTDPALVDSDCDGLSDGAELLSYDMSSPDPTLHGYGDPLAGPCGGLVFEDGFESGSASRWSSVAQ